jgi:hypothetical protein
LQIKEAIVQLKLHFLSFCQVHHIVYEINKHFWAVFTVLLQSLWFLKNFHNFLKLILQLFWYIIELIKITFCLSFHVFIYQNRFFFFYLRYSILNILINFLLLLIKIFLIYLIIDLVIMNRILFLDNTYIRYV